MYKWLIEIYGNGGIVDSLATFKLSTCDQATIIAIPNFSEHLNYFFSSITLNDLDDKSEVLKESKRQLTLLNGICYLFNIGYTPFILNSEPIINTDYEINQKPDNSLNYDKSDIARLIDNLQQNDDYHKIIRLLGKSHNKIEWEDLYKIYEIVKKKYHSLDQSIYKFLRNDPKWTNLTHTANHPNTGDSARHGHSKEDPPPEPMSIETARDMIREICLKLTEKLFDLNCQHYISQLSSKKQSFDDIDWESFRKSLEKYK